MTGHLLAFLDENTRSLILQIREQQPDLDVYEIASELDEVHGLHADPKAVHELLHGQVSA